MDINIVCVKEAVGLAEMPAVFQIHLNIAEFLEAHLLEDHPLVAVRAVVCLWQHSLKVIGSRCGNRGVEEVLQFVVR